MQGLVNNFPLTVDLKVSNRDVMLKRNGVVEVLWLCLRTDNLNITGNFASLVGSHYETAIRQDMVKDRLRSEHGIEDTSSEAMLAVIDEIVKTAEVRMDFTDSGTDVNDGEIIDWAIAQHADEIAACL